MTSSIPFTKTATISAKIFFCDDFFTKVLHFVSSKGTWISFQKVGFSVVGNSGGNLKKSSGDRVKTLFGNTIYIVQIYIYIYSSPYYPKMDLPPLSNLDILELVPKLKIAHFRGVFASDTLPLKPKKNECAIVNLDSSTGFGTHWVCYYKRGRERLYFDSFGSLIPLQLERYLKSDTELKNNLKCIWRQREVLQDNTSSVCGHLCLFALVLFQKFGPHSFNKVVKTISNHECLIRFLNEIKQSEEE